MVFEGLDSAFGCVASVDVGGGTSWKEMSLFFSAFLKSFEISLSRMYFSG